MVTVFCIDCEEPIRLDSRPMVGDVVLCCNCGTEYEVINADPIELDWTYLEPIEREKVRDSRSR